MRWRVRGTSDSNSPARGQRDTRGDLTKNRASDFLPHDSEDGLRSPAVALYNTLELEAPGRRHAEAIDNDVGDLIFAIEGAHAQSTLIG